MTVLAVHVVPLHTIWVLLERKKRKQLGIGIPFDIQKDDSGLHYLTSHCGPTFPTEGLSEQGHGPTFPFGPQY